MTWLIRTKSALESCETHISESESAGSEVESFLAQHLLVILCAEIQEELYGVVDGRARKCGDEEIRAFAVGASKKILRSVKVNEISGFIGSFGAGRKARFTARLDDRHVFQYNSAVDNRHSIAHRSGAQVTISDLQTIIAAAETVLGAARSSLEDEGQSEDSALAEAAAGVSLGLVQAALVNYELWRARLAEATHWYELPRGGADQTWLAQDVERCRHGLILAQQRLLDARTLPAVGTGRPPRF